MLFISWYDFTFFIVNNFILQAMGDIEGDFEDYVMSHIDITLNGNETTINIDPALIEREVIRTIYRFFFF